MSLCAALAGGQWIIALGSRQAAVPWWVWALFPLFFYAAAIQCFRTSRRLTGNERRVWTCFALACFAEGSGEAIWAAYDLYSGIADPFPASAYVGYFSFTILTIAGFWYCMHEARSKRVSLVQLANLATLFSAVLLAYLFLFYGYLESPVSPAVAITSIGYCILSLSAFLFGLIVASLRLSGPLRRVMFLVLMGVGIIAIFDYYFTYIVLNSSYLKTDPSNGFYLLAGCCFIWAGFERTQISADDVDSDALSSQLDDRARLWETLLLPVAVAAVLVIALLFRERLTAHLLPYVVGASTFFVVSLALRNWWGQQLESQLRMQALASEAQLQIANRELHNEIESRSRAEDELRQAQKMEALGRLTGGVAHDFNNLLAVILGNLEMANALDETRSERQAFLLEAIDAANRGASLTQRLLTLSRKQALKPEPIDVGALLDAMRNLLERTLGERIRVEIRNHAAASHCVADCAQLESVLLNLAINARDAMSDGGLLTIEVSERDVAESQVGCEAGRLGNTYVSIAVRDTGAGIPADALDRVFDPYFTTKDIGRGTGLGLSMAYGFAKQSGGRIAIESALGKGTEVRLDLPKTQDRARERAADRTIDLPRGRGERILVVEDEPALRRFVVAFLERSGYAVTAVSNGAQALTVLGNGAPVDLLLSDVALPGTLSGPQLAKAIQEKRPGVKVLFMSGYAEDVRSREGPLWPSHELLRKPFRKTELARTIRATLDRNKPLSVPATRAELSGMQLP